MINLTKAEIEALHARTGQRTDYYRAELLDRNGAVKCPLNLIDFTINHDDTRPINKDATIEFRLPDVTRKVEGNNTSTTTVLKSDDGTLFKLGVDTNGILYTQLIGTPTQHSEYLIQVQDNGLLFTDTASTSVELQLVDTGGVTWNVGVENGTIYTQSTNDELKIYYTSEKVTIDWLKDRIKIYYGVKVNGKVKWWALGVFVIVKSTILGDMVKSNCYDETILLQQSRILDDRYFIKGTPYTDILKYLLNSLNILKVDIPPSTLQTNIDMVLNDEKNNLEWFNYIADMINYTHLSVNADGWFTSKKYVEPSPANVEYVYQANEYSVISSRAENTIDNYNTPNVFKCVVSHPQLQPLVSIYINDDISDPYSTRNRQKVYQKEMLDNIANQVELDNAARKLAFKAKQKIEQVSVTTLLMPHHTSNGILDLRMGDDKNIYVEQGYSMRYKGDMTHKLKRLVVIK